ncbi:SCO1664 family protein [soil metagenome]
MNGTPPAATEALELLSTGETEVLGLLPYSSNYVFLARVRRDGERALAIYKPRRGERPLWDFPRGTLAAREVAAFLVSESAGWRIVPATVLRKDAPMGAGSLQLFIEHDPEEHYFTLFEEHVEEFFVFAAFDVVINNADRKAGHVLRSGDGRLWAVDHGVSFHAQDKLRTVIWNLAQEALPDAVCARLSRLRIALADEDGLGGEITRLLSPREALATRERVERLLSAGRLPSPSSEHHLPWPLI